MTISIRRSKSVYVRTARQEYLTDLEDTSAADARSRFTKPDRDVQRRVLAYLHDLQGRDDPRRRGRGLTANHAGVWHYRVGDYRILAKLIDHTVTDPALSVGHRRNVS